MSIVKLAVGRGSLVALLAVIVAAGCASHSGQKSPAAITPASNVQTRDQTALLPIENPASSNGEGSPAPGKSGGGQGNPGPSAGGSSPNPGGNGHIAGNGEGNKPSAGSSTPGEPASNPIPLANENRQSERPAGPPSAAPHSEDTSPRTEPATPTSNPESPPAKTSGGTKELVRRPAPVAEGIWGPSPTINGSKTGIVYPVAPSAPNVTQEMIDGLKLPETDRRRNVLGVWEQTEGPASPDFAHGGYRQTVLVFRSDGQVDISRFFGDKSETRADYRLSYSLKDDKIVFAKDSKSSAPPARPLRITNSDGHLMTAGAPTSALPMVIKYSATQDRLTIGEKTYRRVKAAPAK